MDLYCNPLKPTLMEWILGTCIFIKFQKFWILALLSGTLLHKSMKALLNTFVSFLWFRHIVVAVVSLFSEFFISFTEFCWETRLLTQNLCTCGSSFLHLTHFSSSSVFLLVWRLWYYALAAILLFLNWWTTNVDWLTRWLSWLAVFFCG